MRWKTLHPQLARALVCEVFLLSGCVSVHQDPAPFNNVLNHRSDRLSGIPSAPGDFRAELSTGMKIQITQTDARSNTVQDRTIIESKTEWIVPSADKFGQADLFQLSWFMSNAAKLKKDGSDVPVDPSVCYEQWLKSDVYPGLFRTNFIKSVLNTLAVSFNTLPNGVPPEYQGGGARYTKALIGDLPSLATDSQGQQTPDKRYRQRLSFLIPQIPTGSTTDGNATGCFGQSNFAIELFDGGSQFQEAGDYVYQNNANRWYRSPDQLPKARSFISVLIPVTVSNSPYVRYVPIDTSIQDIPIILGISKDRFVGVQRDMRLVPEKFVQPGYYAKSILLRPSSRNSVLLNDLEIPFNDSISGDMLLAPGDAIVIN